MAWIVGIDEAGYGPNLGPLVMTSVACRVPAASPGVDFWRLMRKAVRRLSDPDDGRLLVEDSKLVYSTSKGLHDLEKTVLAFLSPGAADALLLSRLLHALNSNSHDELQAEPWYSGRTSLPVEVDLASLQEVAPRWHSANGRHRLDWGLTRSVICCPARFNHMLDHWGTKGAVLGEALGELLVRNRHLDGDEPAFFFIDKHGGRNTYAAMLQQALPDGMVVAHEEGNDRSRYSVLGLGREMRFTFQPRADSEHFGVALASMISKYLRELLMLEFNQFWQTHVPGLKPTAGYPGDADRFFRAIRPAVKRLRIEPDTVWRRR
jgi:ribonuclease HII